MAKKLPLLRRLELALTQASSENEKEEIIGLFGKVAKNSTYSKNLGVFYGNLDQRTLDLQQTREKLEEKNKIIGKDLYSKLSAALDIPSPTIGRSYRRKLDKAVEFEFDFIRNYFEDSN